MTSINIVKSLACTGMLLGTLAMTACMADGSSSPVGKSSAKQENSDNNGSGTGVNNMDPEIHNVELGQTTVIVDASTQTNDLTSAAIAQVCFNPDVTGVLTLGIKCVEVPAVVPAATCAAGCTLRVEFPFDPDGATKNYCVTVTDSLGNSSGCARLEL